MSDSDSDIIMSIFDLPFHKRSFNEKLEVVKNGRPLPPLRNLKKEGKNCVRTFNTDLNEKNRMA